MQTNSHALIVPPPGSSGGTNVLGGDLHPAKPPLDIPAGWSWLGWVLTVLALAALAWWLRKRWRKKQEPLPPAVVVPAHIRAGERLRAALEYFHDPERFCVLVSAAIRYYLEDRFELHAPDRTTEEFLDEVQYSPKLSLPHKQLLSDFLSQCDMVTFARYEPSRPELQTLFDVGKRLVSETSAEAIPTGTPAPGDPGSPGSGGGGTS
jgi:hypothetical protein